MNEIKPRSRAIVQGRYRRTVRADICGRVGAMRCAYAPEEIPLWDCTLQKPTLPWRE